MLHFVIDFDKVIMFLLFSLSYKHTYPRGLLLRALTVNIHKILFGTIMNESRNLFRENWISTIFFEKSGSCMKAEAVASLAAFMRVEKEEREEGVV